MRGVRALDVESVQISLELLRSDLLIESVLEIYLQGRFHEYSQVRHRILRTIFCKGNDFQNCTKFAEYLNASR